MNYTHSLVEDTGDVHPLVLDSKDYLVVLPVPAGQQYRLFTVATDNVGNQQLLSEAMVNVMTAEYPVVIGVCTTIAQIKGSVQI